MIILKNLQRKIPIPVTQLHNDAVEILKKLRYVDYDLSIIITTDRTIRRYNATFRNKDKATDILSFPFHHDLQPGARIRPSDDDERILGDIIISAEYVRHDLPKYTMSFEERLRILLVHGVFHLLGYDHITDEEYRVMQRKETSMLQHLHKVLPLAS